MLTRDFDYELPDEAVAQHPVPRGESRLLVLDTDGAERHRTVRDLPRILRTGDLLVLNDTRVIPARLFGRRPTGGRVELLLVKQRGRLDWDALVKPGRKARPGTVLTLEPAAKENGEDAETGATEVTVEVLSKWRDGRHRIRFSEPIQPQLERLGHVPLPPYIKRPDGELDRDRYQTVWARRPGAIAAPTAGLHFTEEMLDELAELGIEHAPLTLHVGIGTFKPVTAKLVHEHLMDAESYEIPEATATAIHRTRQKGGRVVAVGTTVVRALESATRWTEDDTVVPGRATTTLFIVPGHRFQVVDVLLTNFHLPRSTLLMLVSAFAGRERVLAAYREALELGYRFYSYGDAMLARRRGSAG